MTSRDFRSRDMAHPSRTAYRTPYRTPWTHYAARVALWAVEFAVICLTFLVIPAVLFVLSEGM